MNLIHCGIILLIGIAASGLRVSAATPVQILADRLANITNDYVFVVADGGFGFEPGSREALATALQSGADIIALHVHKDAAGRIMVNARTSFSEALSVVGDKAMVMVSGFEEFPEEIVAAYKKSRNEVLGLMLNTSRSLTAIRKRTVPAGLTDPNVQAIYRRRLFYVPTVPVKGGEADAAIDIHYLRIAEVQVCAENRLSALSRVRMFKSGTKLMLDTTADEHSAGHGDLRALPDPDGHWGWCLRQGAQVIRTGRPAELCRYLERCGRRDFQKHGEVLSYAAEGAVRVALVPALVPAPREMTVSRGLVPADVKVSMRRDGTLPREGYRLDVNPSGISIVSADGDGEYWAHQTLAQLKGEVNGRPVYPVVSIRDWPEFRWRGAHMDDSRHFIGKDGVKNFIDAMSRHKLNVFHWHPNDDQGWRLPLKGFPDLAKYGSVLRKRDGTLYGPFAYAEADVKEILAYAKERHVKVVPEFEIPGHNRALVCSYPEIACASSRPGKGYPKDGGCFDSTVQPNSICAGDDAAIRTVERMLDALCELFPDADTIHVGGDEVNKLWWRNCPKCQARIKALGLKDEKALQSWLIRHFVKYLSGKGVKAIGWDEIVDGGIPENLSVMYWRGGGFRSNQIATSNRTEVVACPSSHCYYDKDQLLPQDRYSAFGACPLPLAYSYDPYDGIAPEYRRFVIGTEGLLWAECIKDADELMWKAYPRLCATAEIAWTYPAQQRKYDDFLRRLNAHIPRLRAWGIGSAPTPEMQVRSGEEFVCNQNQKGQK